MVNKSQSKEVQKKEIQGAIQIPPELMDNMQKTLDLCVPATSKAVQTINDSLVIANGLNSLREFFQNDEVKKLVETMQDTTVGFLTDRSPEALIRANKNKTGQWVKEPYTYDEIVEALMPPMLEGYRFTGNEINIIAGNGMQVKKGKYRKVTELVNGFSHSVGGPTKEGTVAKMKCRASWKSKDGVEQSIGYDPDLCIIHVEFGKYDGIDKLIGLAESKLLSRVLTRISGKLVIEGDVHEPENKEINPEDKPKEKSKAKNIMDVEQPEKKPVEKPKVSFVEKLGTVVDDKEYSSVIQELLKEEKIKKPDSKQNILRTDDEETAKNIFNLIEDRKDIIDSAAKDAKDPDGESY